MLNLKKSIIKVIRFICIYGPLRTIIKISGRLQSHLFIFSKKHGNIGISIIGCGQFAYSTICYFLKDIKGVFFNSCYDIDKKRSIHLARSYNFKTTVDDFRSILNNTTTKFVYIASNHYSHTDYAIEFLKNNINVYVEKPISVDEDQLGRLLYHVSHSKGKIFAGYNRPFSQAMVDFKREAQRNGCNQDTTPFTINCFITGHMIEKNHWYRDPKEGTRICGNIGHWLDLAIHLLSWRGSLPDLLKTTVLPSDIDEPDDNISISMVSDKHDLISIVLSSRSEPFEGINETINIQFDKITAKIDDFRKMHVWIDDVLIKKRYWPKDVGHKRAVQQPFHAITRNWHEVELSTFLMIHIKNMVLSQKTIDTFSLKKALETLDAMRNGTFNQNQLI